MMLTNSMSRLVEEWRLVVGDIVQRNGNANCHATIVDWPSSGYSDRPKMEYNVDVLEKFLIAELRVEVEKLKEEPAKRGEELVHKDKKPEKVEEVLTDDVANSYMTGFEDVVAQASGIYPEMDFSQLGLGNTVVDG
ncbi:hypothetical protein ACSQ67_025183 [Phaseolus vulgaris]